MAFTIVSLPKEGGRQTVTFLGGFDALTQVFKLREVVSNNPQWHPEVAHQLVYIRVMFSIANYHLEEVDGVWVSSDNKTWSCVFNRENNQIGSIDVGRDRMHHYLDSVPNCLRRAIQSALERAAMRRLAKHPDLFPKTRRNEGQ